MPDAVKEKRFVSGKQVLRYYVRGYDSRCPACGCPDSLAEGYVGWYEERTAPVATPAEGGQDA